MLRSGGRGRLGILLALAPALVAIAARLPSPPEPEAAEPWLHGSYGLQGIRMPGDAGESRGDIVVTLPLAVIENASYVVARIAGGAETGDRGGWIRSHPEASEKVLWIIWIAAAAAAAGLAARTQRGGAGILVGLLVAIAPVGLAGARRLDGWSLAAPLVLAALFPIASAVPGIKWGARRTLILALIWGALLSLTPLGWLLALICLAMGRRSDRPAILLSIPLWFALDPSRLVDPVGAVSALVHGFVFTGWPGLGDGPAGKLLLASWTPGPIILLLALVGAWHRVKTGDYPATLGFLVLWFIPAALGARRPDGVGVVTPAVIVLSVEGAMALYRRSARGRALVATALVLLLAAPLAAGAVREIKGDAERRTRVERLAEVVREQVGEGMLLLRDPAAPTLPETTAAFALPMYVERPEAWDFAYWPGWYGAFSFALFKARTLELIEIDHSRRPAGRSLLAALAGHADPVVSLGDPATDRGALILFRLRPGPPWTPPSIREPWDGVKASRAEARFLADLGGFLAENGRGRDAIEVLRLAVKWDDSDAKGWNNLGSTLLMMGEAQSAAETFEQGLRREPTSLELRYNLAKAFLAGNIPGRAALELRRVLQANPGFAPAHYDLARAAAAEGNWPLATQALEAYLAMNPGAANREQIEGALAEARRRAEETRSARASRRLRPADGADE